MANELGARSVAFPAISTGLYRWPMDSAARIALRAVAAADSGGLDLDEVRFVLFGQDALEVFAAAHAELSGR